MLEIEKSVFIHSSPARITSCSWAVRTGRTHTSCSSAAARKHWPTIVDAVAVPLICDNIRGPCRPLLDRCLQHEAAVMCLPFPIGLRKQRPTNWSDAKPTRRNKTDWKTTRRHDILEALSWHSNRDRVEQSHLRHGALFADIHIVLVYCHQQILNRRANGEQLVTARAIGMCHMLAAQNFLFGRKGKD